MILFVVTLTVVLMVAAWLIYRLLPGDDEDLDDDE
jgi:hypothetical protein